MLVPQGEGSGTPTEPYHTPSPEAQQTSFTTPSSPTLPSVTTAPIPTVTSSDTPSLRQYTRRARIAQSSALPPVANEPASPLRDVSKGEACPTDTGFGADKDRANIAKASTLPYDSAPRVTSPAAAKGSMQQTLNELTAFCTSLQRQHSELISKFEAQELEINMLKVRVKLLEDREGGGAERSEDDALIKGRNLDEGDAAAKRVSDDTEEMANVLTSMDATTVLASRVAEVPTGNGSIPTAGPPAAEVPTGSDMVPTAGPNFTTVTVVTPYTRRKGKETMVESETPNKKKVQEQIDAQVARELEEQMAREDQRMTKQVARDVEIARIHAEEELQIMIDGLDKSNETVAKYLQEYHQFASKLPLERRIELTSDLVRYQDNYAKIENFIPMGSKEEAERFKRKGIRFEQESVKKLKTSEEVLEEVKSPNEVLEEKVKEMMQLVPIEEVYVEALQVKHPIIDWKVHIEGQRSYWKVTRLGGSSASYQFFIDMLKHLDREDLNQLWALVKESLSNRPPTSDKEIELWVELKRLYEPDDEDQLWAHTQNLMHAPVEWKLYDTCGVHHVTAKDKEIFMLVEKDYPLRKGLAIGMISYKLQVENYSKMANDLILKIYKIASSPRQQVIEFSLPEEVPTASEESCHCQKKREATAVKIALLLKSRRNCQSKSNDSYAKIKDKIVWTPAWIMPPTMMTQSAGRPAATSRGRGAGGRAGSGGGGRTRGHSGDQGDGRIDGQGGQVGGQGSEVNDGVNGVPDFSTIITQELHNLLPTIVAQVGDQSRGQGNGRNQNGDVVNDIIRCDVSRGCTYKEFLAFNPKKCDGKGGAIVYTRWIKKMESVQDMSGCRDSQKVCLGKTLTREEFCPSNEMQKLETELWNHAMVGAGHVAYTDRFHELARLVPHLVTPEGKRIESNGSIKKNPEKRRNRGEPSKDRNVRDDNKRTRIGNAFAISTNPVGRENTGTVPKCTICSTYHPPGMPCRTCFNWVNHHKVAINGGQSHVNEGNQARGRAFMLGAKEARQDPNIATGTFTLNDHYATTLFDSGVDYRFISTTFIPLLGIEPSDLGMDWLSDQKVEIIFHEKVMRTPLLDGKVLGVLGEKPEEKVRQLMSAKTKEKKQDDIVVVRDFLEIPVRLKRLRTRKPLKLRLSKTYDWGEEHENAFQTLKDKLCSAPVLALPDGSEDFLVYCDAFGLGLGCVLMQRGKANVVADTLNRRERVKPKRVKGINMILQSSVKDRILAAQKEASDEYAGLQKGLDEIIKLRNDGA
uniref:Reverse transcriptase/retrotransposon-derived protein RNase H-like domain-containing protein n=1 Tax=Tanacetum cinerariifolium TaxID=118510 RepID=A0A6L2N1G7_TANCI|nr:hypothetical protein [Tanacetum cinerariifolium]